MAIYEPEIFLSSTDRELLQLLGQLVLAQHPTNDNISGEQVTLSPSEGKRLLVLLEQFVESKLFQEGSYFAEGMANGEAWHDDAIREIYLSWRKRRGRTRVMAGRHWNEFVLRAGFRFSESARMYVDGPLRTPVRPMPLDHFLKMEARLLKAASVHPRVAQLVLDLVRASRPSLEKFRQGEKKIERGTIVSRVKSVFGKIRDAQRGLERRPLSKFELVSVATIITDTTTLFTTRDWTATGVISNLAAVMSQSYRD